MYMYMYICMCIYIVTLLVLPADVDTVEEDGGLRDVMKSLGGDVTGDVMKHVTWHIEEIQVPPPLFCTLLI